MKEKKIYTTYQKIKIVLLILLLSFLTYSLLVFICHFSVYNTFPDYSIIDSVNAAFGKSQFENRFIFFFGLSYIFTALILVGLNFIFKKKQ